MTNYVKTTNFTAKDALPTGNAGKVVKGAEHDTEYDAIAVAIATKADTSALTSKADLASPTFTGTVTLADLDATGQVIIGDQSTSAVASSQANELIIDNGSISGISLLSSTLSSVVFGNAADPDGASLAYYTSFGNMDITVNGAVAIHIDSDQNVGIGTDSPQGNLHVFGSNVSGGSISSLAADLVVENGGAGAGMTIISDSASFGSIYFADQDASKRAAIEYNHSTDDMLFYTSGSFRVMIDDAGRVGIGTGGPTGLLDIVDDCIRVRNSQTPASASATGNQGEIAWDANYIYICTATNTWKRVAIATW